MSDQEFPLLIQASPGVLHFGGARMALLEIESGFWSICHQMEALIGPRLTKSVLRLAVMLNSLRYFTIGLEAPRVNTASIRHVLSGKCKLTSKYARHSTEILKPRPKGPVQRQSCRIMDDRL